MLKNSRNEQHKTERLKDLRALRQTLQHRRDELDTRIKNVEASIRKLRGGE